MRITQRKIAGFVALAAGLLVFSWLWMNSVLANGGKAKTVRYMAQMPLDTDTARRCVFSTEANPVLFYFTTVNNKYQVLSVRVENRTKTPLKLSKTQDQVELKFGAKAVTGVLDLPANDRSTWDAVDPEMRKAVVYPQLVEAGEEEGIYVYVPAEALKDFRPDQRMPNYLTLTIASLGKSVELHRPETGAKK